jgi:hypothetical protein
MIDVSKLPEGNYFIRTKDGVEKIAYRHPSMGISFRCFRDWDEWVSDVIEIRGPIIFDQLPLITKATEQ